MDPTQYLLYASHSLAMKQNIKDVLIHYLIV